MDIKGKGRASQPDEHGGRAAGSALQTSEVGGAPTSSTGNARNGSPPAVAIITIGMAGSGKTTFIHRLTSYLHSEKKPPYVLNLDPAVANLGYEANIDIRDTVDYKEVMKQYNLGPNGGILTALNLFTTKFDQVLSYIEKKASSGKTPYILVDTPGQIEIFTWSASGTIVSDALASALPTVVAYIIDTPRTASPETFMSNMLYACSILYKTKLPFILVFNKTDVKDWLFAQEWMTDFESFQEALLRKKNHSQDGSDETEGGFMTSLMTSMSLMLEEFYRNLRACGVSAMSGDGMEDFFDKVEEARQEYEELYKPELVKVQEARKQAREASKSENMDRLMKDMNLDKKNVRAPSPTAKPPAKDILKRNPHDLLAELEDQEKLEDLEEAERGYNEDSDNEVTIDRADHDMYQDLRKEHMRRSGQPSGRKAAVVEDGLGGRWPAP